MVAERRVRAAPGVVADRGSPARSTADADRAPIEGDRDRAVEVRPVDPRADGTESGEGGRCRMAVGVVGPDRGDGDLRVGRRHEWFRRGGPTAVVGDLEHVDVGQPAGQQHRVHVLLDVAGQQESPPGYLAQEDDRHAVDQRAIARRIARDVAAVRPEDLDGDVIDPQARASAEHEVTRRPGSGQSLLPRRVRRARAAHARLGHGPDAIAVQQQDEPGHVVLVWMGEHDRIDPPIPRRDATVELAEEAIRVRATVDQQTSAP
jgi:hypothetical protein